MKSDHTPLSAAYYEFDGDGLPTVQARRGDYDVNHYYAYDDARAASREATAGCHDRRASRRGRIGWPQAGTLSGPRSRPLQRGATIMPGVGTILSVREGDDSRFVHTDVQGTTRKVTSAAEAVIAAYDLDAFGVQRSHTGAYSTPYLFTGKERDPGPGLDYFIARQYKAGRGLFLSKDPLFPETHAYTYVEACPLVEWDPDGMLSDCWRIRLALTLGVGGTPDMLRKAYLLVADYLIKQGMTVTGSFLRKWIEGSTPPTVEWSWLFMDPGIRDAFAAVKSYLLDLVTIRDCCWGHEEPKRWPISVWPWEADHVGAMGYFRMTGSIYCYLDYPQGPAAGPAWPTPARRLRCELEFRASDNYDFRFLSTFVCLPNCRPRIYLMSALQDLMETFGMAHPFAWKAQPDPLKIMTTLPCPTESCVKDPAKEGPRSPGRCNPPLGWPGPNCDPVGVFPPCPRPIPWHWCRKP